MKASILGLAAGFLFLLAGCEPAASTPAAPAPEKQQQTEEEKEIAEALSKLSAEDRALAEKQKICPVTDEPLGSMGVPQKITVEGKDVFICCEGCEDAIRKEPAKYFEKIGKND